jgi:hypothetical protein
MVLVFVAGCHRSGTSLLASVLIQSTGLSSGERPDDLEPQVDNPLGFFESQSLVELNEALLRFFGFDWNRPPLIMPRWDQPDLLPVLVQARSRFSRLALSDRWIDKDPRLCITLPAFVHILLKRVPVAAVVRSPLDVATSLYWRDSIPLNDGLVLWFLYNHHLAMSLRSNDFLSSYQALIGDENSVIGVTLLERLYRFLVDNWSQRLEGDVISSCLRAVRAPELNRAAGVNASIEIPDDVSDKLLRCCLEAYEDIMDNALPSIASYKRVFNCLPRQVLHSIQQADLWRHLPSELLPNQSEVELDAARCIQLQQQLESCQFALSEAHGSLLAMQASTSWRVMGPVRGIFNLMRRNR